MTLPRAHVHIRDRWRRLRLWLTDGPIVEFHEANWHPDGRGPRVMTACAHCGADPDEHCDAGMHS